MQDFFWGYVNLVAGHWCFIIHRLNPETCVDLKKWSVKGDHSGVEIILTSCTHFDVQSQFLFLITYNHKTNH